MNEQTDTTPDPVTDWLVSLGWTPVTTQTGLVISYQFRRVVVDVVLATQYYERRVDFHFGPPKF